MFIGPCLMSGLKTQKLRPHRARAYDSNVECWMNSEGHHDGGGEAVDVPNILATESGSKSWHRGRLADRRAGLYGRRAFMRRIELVSRLCAG